MDIDTDTEANKRQQIFHAIADEFGNDKVVNIVTFKTEGSRSALLTACRGLGINSDDAQELSDYIKSERGQQWSIHDCLYGNEDKEREKVNGFKEKIDDYPLLEKTALKIEGLIVGRSIHASGIIIYPTPIVDYNSVMRAPNGSLVTAFNMNDSEEMGGLKFDALTIEGLDKIRVETDMLVEFGEIEWQGSLRQTYDKYLHPDVLDYTTEEMWEFLDSGEIASLFQFDTDVGGQAQRAIKPRSLKELALANSVMRLMGNDGESPIDRFIRYKGSREQAIGDMNKYLLNQEEKDVVEELFRDNFLMAIEQEDIMEMVMHPKTVNFNMTEANKIRKIIAKKKTKEIEDMKNFFFKKGEETRTRKNFLNYLWNECVGLQLGYSFSRNHTSPYSAIALQEMNLYHRYNSLYWNTAVLTVEASAVEEGSDSGAINYGKMATAINIMKNRGVEIGLPDINKAKYGFHPDIENNLIVFGLKGINGVGDEASSAIINGRHYNSVDDFLEKNYFGESKLTSKVACINLVKAGAFDSLEKGKERLDIMTDMLYTIYIDTEERVKPLDYGNLAKLAEMNMIPETLLDLASKYYYGKHVISPQFFHGKIQNRKWYSVEEGGVLEYFQSEFMDRLEEDKEFEYSDNGILVLGSRLDKLIVKDIEPLTDWMKSDEALKAFNKEKINMAIREDLNKYCKGSYSKWEMDSLNFYHSEHELANVDKELYDLSDFNELSPIPKISKMEFRNGRQYPKYELFRVAGTVLDKNKMKYTVSLLTCGGVIKVKFYQGDFAYYNKRISENIAGTDKKRVLENSWFARGNKLAIVGFRREDQFVPRTYRDNAFSHKVMLIEDVREDGSLALRTERVKK